jgi:hypothetical protein
MQFMNHANRLGLVVNARCQVVSSGAQIGKKKPLQVSFAYQ